MKPFLSKTLYPVLTVFASFAVFEFASLANHHVRTNYSVQDYNIKIQAEDSGNRIKESSSGFVDTRTGDIIGKELDENGNLRDCTIGTSSSRRNLPSCNDIIDRREKVLLDSRNRSRFFLTNKLSGNNIFILPNGSKIRVKSSVKYNDETQYGRGGGELIINAYVERVSATLPTFENLFINPGSRLEISFLDADDFELLDSLSIPLHVETGLSTNVSYKKKVGLTSSDLIGMKVQARMPIRSIREYKLIRRVSVAARFGEY